MSIEKAILLGKGAEKLLTDEAANLAVKNVIENLKDEWINTNPDNVSGREAIWRQVHSVQLLVAELVRIKSDGMVEEARFRQAEIDATRTPVYN